jgi:hypothetical protein
MDSIPEDKAGVGSATNDASREVGGALGIAIGGSVLNEIYQNNIVVPKGLDITNYSQDPTESFPAAMRIGSELIGKGDTLLGSELIANARLAFMDGMVGTAMVSAGVALITAVLVKFYMPGKTK